MTNKDDKAGTTPPAEPPAGDSSKPAGGLDPLTVMAAELAQVKKDQAELMTKYNAQNEQLKGVLESNTILLAKVAAQNPPPAGQATPPPATEDQGEMLFKELGLK